MNRLILFAACIAILISSCKKEKALLTQISQPPIANAGADQTIILPADSVELRGSGTDADGQIVRYEWTTLADPSQYTFAPNNTPIAKVKNLVEGVYEFELKVTDDDGLSGKDNIIVTVVGSSVPIIARGYQSKQSGNWKDASSWERFDGTHWVDALIAPSGSDGQINIRAGHSITINSPEEASQVIVNQQGVLTIVSDFTLTNELINNGTLDWQDGSINLLGVYWTVTLTNNGNFLISGNNDTWSYWWDSNVRIVNNGTITKTSTGFTSLEYVHSLINTFTGVIQGLGTLYVNGDISWLPEGFNNYGTIAPGLPLGILAINRVLQPFSSGSILNIEVQDNSGPGTGHDQLVCNNNITLNGTLTVTEIGTTVSNGRFTILNTSGTVDGNFSRTNLPPGYSVQINRSSVDLVKQ